MAVIADAIPDRIFSGTSIVIRTPQAGNIGRVAAVRCGSCTHAFNPDQRFVELKFKWQGSDILLVDIPKNGNVMPSGLYFYVVIDKQGLPSLGSTVFVNPDPLTDPERQWKDLEKFNG